jgi:hypothetical protein
MIKVSEETIGRRTHISPSDDENAKCSGSNLLDPPNASSLSTPPFKTPSKSNAISSHAASSSSFARQRLLSGGNAAYLPEMKLLWSSAE